MREPGLSFVLKNQKPPTCLQARVNIALAYYQKLSVLGISDGGLLALGLAEEDAPQGGFILGGGDCQDLVLGF